MVELSEGKRLIGARLSGAVPRSQVVSTAIHLSGFVAKFAAFALLARLMGVLDYGRLNFILTAGQIAGAIGGLGLPMVVLRHLPTLESKGEAAIAKFLVLFSAGCVVAGALTVGALPLVAGAFVRVPHREFLLALPIAVLWALATRAIELHRAIGDVAWAFAPSLVGFPVLLAVFVFACARAGVGYETAGAVAICAGLLVTVCAQEMRFWKSPVGARLRSVTLPGSRIDSIRTWLGEGAFFSASGIGTMLLSSVDVVVVGWVAGLKAAGIYAAASRTARLAGIGLTAANAAVAGDISRMLSTGALRELKATVRTSVIIAISLSALVSLPMLLFPRTILGVYGSGFRGGWVVLVALAAAQVINAATGPGTYLLNLSGHHKVMALGACVSAVSTAAAVAAAAEFWGVSAAGLASAVGVTIFNLWAAAACRARIGFVPVIGLAR